MTCILTEVLKESVGVKYRALMQWPVEKAGVQFRDCLSRGCGSLDCLNPFSFPLGVHSSPTGQLLSKRIRQGVHCGGIRQSAYNRPPQLWINQHWCKTIKPMQYDYLFILITQCSTFWITPSKCITWRGLRSQTSPAIFILLCALCLGPEAVQQSTKAAIR